MPRRSLACCSTGYASARAAERSCGALALADTLSATAALMADARQAQAHAAKNEAMRQLLRSAGWQWAAWMLAGLVLLKLSRWPRTPLVGVALALLVWALAAWMGRVPWPFGTDHAFEPARPSDALLGMPAPFVLAMVAAAGFALIASTWLPRTLTSTTQTLASRVGYPGLVIATFHGTLTDSAGGVHPVSEGEMNVPYPGP